MLSAEKITQHAKHYIVYNNIQLWYELAIMS